MKLRQLRYIHEVAKRGLNVSNAADALFTSQPGVSKQIRLLEEELGVDIFVRTGKHLSEITPAGAKILEYAQRLLTEVNNIERVAEEFHDADRGELSIATTHTQARYALPQVIQAFRKQYPHVRLHLHQGSPPQIAKMAAEGQADFAIATEALHHFDSLVMLPCYRWNRCVLVKPDHPLASIKRIELRDIAQYPVITYTFGFTGRSQLDQAFAAHGLRPEVVLTAVDADVIKTYVRLGMGIGIVASMAYNPELDRDLVRVPVDHLFASSITHIGYRRGLFLRGYMYEFLQLFAPHLNEDLIKQIDQISDPELRAQQVKKQIASVPTLE
ncbi:HTH-type transcriptional regulator CysB [Sinimarinibacterium sp. NLF-5-8]|uniref:HTH-type transcriptional regulator CysB n=1 Tax=Sinimarinibacterium sp. NLF-5-8 TaxID=2698684 RepID=UPI00137C1731|nr:HTH-type transcriptional regulator CysB [Sinimarinibacterium sp. NLF-5-8]QHS09855.1 HTH-type transcriptional regulator CysB [Sinimarinibacterium sp. NLF-5-8]